MVMKLIKIKTLSFIIMLIPTFLFAQREQIIFSNTKNKSIDLNRNNNYEVSEIMRILGSQNSGSYNPSNTQRFNFEETSRIFKAARNLHFKGFIKNAKYSSTPKYRDFNLTKLVLPSKISFDMDWVDSRQKRVSQTYHAEVKLNNRKTVLFNFTKPNTIHGTNFAIRIKNYKLYYDRNTFIVLRNYLNLINDYYLSDGQISRLIRECNSIQTYGSANQFENNEKLKKVKNQFASIEQKDFENQLINPLGDPLFLQRKINTLRNTIKHKENELNNGDYNNNSGSAKDLVDKGIRAYNSGNYGIAQDFYNRALIANPNYMPAKLELSRLFYHNNHAEKAISYALEVEKSYNSSQYTRSGATSLLKDFYNNEFNSANTELRNQNYSNALTHIQNAEEICRNSNSISCGYQLSSMRTQVMDNYSSNEVATIENYINSGNLKTASKATTNLENAYLRKGMSGNKQQITELWRKIYNKYLSKAQSDLYTANYDNALSNTNEAEKICRTKTDIYCSNDLTNYKKKAEQGIYQQKLNLCKSFIDLGQMLKASAALTDAQAYRTSHNLKLLPDESNYQSRLKQKQYSLSAQEALNYYRNGNYDLALKKYAEVLEIQKRYGLPSDPQIQAQINEVAGAKAQKSIDLGTNELKRNNQRSAKRYAKDAQEILNKYNVPKTNSVYQQLTQLKNATYSTQCQGYQDIYDKKIEYAQKKMKDGKYTTAQSTLNQAIAYAKSKTECEIDYADAETYKEQIKPAVYFEKELKDIYNLIDYKIYADAVKKYLALIDYYNENRLDAMNVAMLPLVTFAQSGTSDFILYMANYLYEQNEYTQSYDLLKELQKRDIRKTYTKELQSKLAIALAKQDYTKDPLSKVASRLLEYTYNNSWWSYFKKSYTTQWKILR